MTRAFNWPALMRAGLGSAGLSPGEFWSLTPYEFQLLMRQTKSSVPLDRKRLAELVKSYPDRRREENE